ncbi:F-box domain cyclin-containing protein [Neofusicoccum parvum]|uniref:F-box domain cyclin-containing protein n=1 Tax=Neofusicoccum parvum TaxID=310453 RepID=A0ACB5RN71_9PEZI|nr:F-box domain cyclin-containing protein [Neofusicoccum parvum]
MPGTSLDGLPLDIKLRIVESCELTGLIKLRCVSRAWRNLVLETDISLLNPTRRALLDLYDFALDSKWFQHSRRHIIPDIQHFDRRQYLEDLPGTSVPEEFEMWIREWPEKAVIGWLWPGLEDWAPSFDKPDDEWWRIDARNFLSAEFVEEFRDLHEGGREHTKCNLFVDRELPPMHQTEEQQPDIEATAIQVQFAFPNDSYDQDPQDPMGCDPLGNVMLILSNGGRFDGTVHQQAGVGEA